MSGDVAVIGERPTADWNERAVLRPGGHVFQSLEWAEHWRLAGRTPLFISVGDARVLGLLRRWPLVPGGSVYLSRGPAPTVGGDVLGPILAETTRALAESGADVVAADPEVAETDAAYAGWLVRTRFHPIEEIQPSRHRLRLPLAGIDEPAAFARITKSTRQRIRQAERTVRVVRFDATAGAGEADERFGSPAETSDAAFRRFYNLLLETGERRSFRLGPPGHFVGWWRRALDAGLLVYLEARELATDAVLGGLLLYRHGGRLSTAHSGDLVASRRDHPGAMHLLRWRAVQLAILEGLDELDMGGVDVRGARREPREGEPGFGLYEHKRSFGAEWVALRGAQERIIRPRRYLAGRVLARALRSRVGG